MALIIGTILALLSIAVAVYPFVRHRAGATEDAHTPAAGASRPNGTADSAGPDTPALDSIYAAIHTLQLERELGNIPEGLYREQLDDYRRQAAVALREQALAQTAGSDRALEEEIRAARAALGRDSDPDDRRERG